MPKFYTSRQVVEDLMLTEISDNFVDEFERMLEHLESYIDSYTGRNFVADSSYAEKTFDGDGDKELIIPDCIEVDSITITDDSGASEEYELADDYFLVYPANSTPYTRLVFRDNNSLEFTEGQQNITISAKWGYSSAVPKEIEFAATILMAGMINYAYEHNSEEKSETIGNYQVTYQREDDWVKYKLAMDILDKYKKVSF